MKETGNGLLNWFMKQSVKTKGYRRAIWSGVTSLEAAKFIEYAAGEKATGIYNMVYKEPINKYDLLLLFNKYLRNNSIAIEPSDDFIIDRSLKRTRFELDYIVPDYEKMISEMADWMRLHKQYYKHYQI
jgi:dTDP-4-dehydrorhamnose reductase